MKLPWCAATSELIKDESSTVRLICTHGTWQGSQVGDVLEAWLRYSHPELCPALLDREGNIADYVMDADSTCQLWVSHKGRHNVEAPAGLHVDVDTALQKAMDDHAQRLLEKFLDDMEREHGPITEEELQEAREAWYRASDQRNAREQE